MPFPGSWPSSSLRVAYLHVVIAVSRLAISDTRVESSVPVAGHPFALPAVLSLALSLERLLILHSYRPYYLFVGHY